MPSTYAHHRMGLEIIRKLNEHEQMIIRQNRELFLIGLHGPDIFFYYKPLYSNSVNRIGYGTHEKAGREFFEHAARVIKEHGFRSSYIAYTYGFICHFALDVSCHGYIDEKIAQSGVAHTEIEVEFDRILMLLDGKDPIRQNLVAHISPSERNAAVIRHFFDDASVEDVQKSLDGMIRYNHLLVAPFPLKRGLIKLLLLASGNYHEMHGLVVNYRHNRKCTDSNRKLMRLYKDASALAVSLIREFDGYLNGTADLNSVYDLTFGSKPTTT